jgi:hypothetical protein
MLYCGATVLLPAASLQSLKADEMLSLPPGMAFVPQASGRHQPGVSDMGARLVNARKKARRRAHKKTPEQREALLALTLKQNAQRAAVSRR